MAKEEQNNLPTVRDEAKGLIEKYRKENNLVYVNEEELQTPPMFLPEIVKVRAETDDFHEIQKDVCMPKSHQENRIGEAAGISYIEKACGTRKEGEYVWIGRSQGKKRLPDGSWRDSQVHEYEYDAEKRAEEDFIKHPDWYKTDTAKKKHLLELARFGRQKASTGAHLKVIRELTGMPTSFPKKDIARSMVFCRIVINTNYLMQQPEFRDTAIKHALGAKETIYGPDRQLEHQPQYEVSGNGEAQEAEEIPFDTPAEPEPDLEHNLDVVNSTIGRIEDWLNLPATIKKYGAFDKEKIIQGVSP